ncbi:MAG: response regulator [Rectinemataceae bacterium]
MRKLLVIDDSSTSRAIVERLIGAAYELVSVGSGIAALEAIEAQRFDLVLLDLLMPDMDGKIVLVRIKEGHPELPVVIMTADIQDSTRAKVLSLGAEAMINKPLLKDKLTDAIELALGRHTGTSD